MIYPCRKLEDIINFRYLASFIAKILSSFLQEIINKWIYFHTNNKNYFVHRPSQKSPIPLNRYDDFIDDLSYRSQSQEQTPESRLVARALYNFVGQMQRELTFRRGDLIFVRRQVDKNWYEGEHNAMIGLFPFNYVEVSWRFF